MWSAAGMGVSVEIGGGPLPPPGSGGVSVGAAMGDLSMFGVGIQGTGVVPGVSSAPAGMPAASANRDKANRAHSAEMTWRDLTGCGFPGAGFSVVSDCAFKGTT